MRQDFAIRWIESAPDLFEARVTLPDGHDMYVGYVASASGAVVWRGYVGTTGAVTTAPVCVACRPLRVEGATDAPAPTEGDHHER